MTKGRKKNRGTNHHWRWFAEYGNGQWRRRERPENSSEPEPRADKWLEQYVRDLHRDEDDLERSAPEPTIGDDKKLERGPVRQQKAANRREKGAVGSVTAPHFVPPLLCYLSICGLRGIDQVSHKPNRWCLSWHRLPANRGRHLVGTDWLSDQTSDLAIAPPCPGLAPTEALF